MKNWEVEKVNYYQVNNKKFFDESEANDYALKLFLVEEISKILKKNSFYDKYSFYIDDDNSTIVVHIYQEPYYDNWNVGHYGCTEPTVIDRSRTHKYKTIKHFCNIYESATKKLFEIADSINIANISTVLDEDNVENMKKYKEMVNKIKNAIK